MYLPLIKSFKTSSNSATKVVYPANYYISLYETTNLPIALAKLINKDEFLT